MAETICISSRSVATGGSSYSVVRLAVIYFSAYLNACGDVIASWSWDMSSCQSMFISLRSSSGESVVAAPISRRTSDAWGTPANPNRTSMTPNRFWQTRFYDFNVWTERKRLEKLRYIHRNPVTRGLVASPELWPWSSFRWYRCGEVGPVKINDTDILVMKVRPPAA